MIAWFSNYPALGVEFGAAYVLAIAFLARWLSRRLGVPSIVPLLVGGFIAGPSGLALLDVALTQPAVRALMSLAVVVVLFEVTLRVDLGHIPRRTVAMLALFGPATILVVVPIVGRSYHLTPLVASMVASICVVTGPTVIGPLMARLRPPSALGHLLETEGLVLDALGVIIAAVTFASFTSRPTGPIDATAHAVFRVAIGLLVGLAFGFAGKLCIRFLANVSSDIGKLFILLLAFTTYAVAELLSHESGLVAVVACGLLMDYRSLPYERLLRSFKEDLSMLALSVVFVLLASQIDAARAIALIMPALGIVTALILIRIATVLLGTLRSSMPWPQRLLMMSVFPRGIVAVSLGTYYATQVAAWGLHGGNRLAALLFLIVVVTIVISSSLSAVVTRVFHLRLPLIVFAGISTRTLQSARRANEHGYRTLMVDRDDASIALARSNDIEAEYVEKSEELRTLIGSRGGRTVVVDSGDEWSALIEGRARGLRIIDVDTLSRDLSGISA